MASSGVTTATIGFPRIGPNREMKKALESYWKGALPEASLLETAASVEAAAWKAQADAGIALVGLDGTLYDQVLDMSFALGLVPKRFAGLTGLARYFAMARGGGDNCPALDMSKYFNTNYHYLVPEIDNETAPKLDATSILERARRGVATVGAGKAVPMVVGPVTIARLAKLSGGADVGGVVAKLQPLYLDLLKQLKGLGVPEVQLLEPALCLSAAPQDQKLYEATYAGLSSGVPINLVTFFDDLGDAFPWAVKLPVAAVSLDFRGVVGAAIGCRTLEQLKKNGFPTDKRLGAGVIDGRGVWAETGQAEALLREIRSVFSGPISVQSSCSLQMVPLDAARETCLPESLRPRLAFAQQKLAEIVAIAGAAGKPSKSGGAVAPTDAGKASMPAEALMTRPAPYAQRRIEQFKAHPELPLFPTTTIGSFPQTASVRAARAAFKAGKINRAELEARTDAFVAHMIGVQEGLGLDVLVHGEPERTDMVEFFGRQLEGLAFTEHGWVQSYGSRYVRPPIVHDTVRRKAAAGADGDASMTVREYKVAAALTQRPVKGMLTGPVTILNWSFARQDAARSATAFELAAALREEVSDLEAAGCTIIQVDEPALREGLPLKSEQWDSYLSWAVAAFRASTGAAAPRTQIVTHLCYSDFEDIMPAIDALDADVLTIENSRSGDAMLTALATAGYSKDLGPGVYDVHSPSVPPVAALVEKLRAFVATGILGGDARRIWVNPDCGLKTRGWPEVVSSLRNMVEAARVLRAEAA